MAAFTGCTLLLFAFIYWQTAVFETGRIDAFIVQLAASAARESPQHLRWTVNGRLSDDLHRLTFAALFDAGGRKLAGNLGRLPPDLPVDGKAHSASLGLVLAPGKETVELVRAVARRLPDGNILVVARNQDELVTLRRVVLRALGLGLIPAVLLALGAGLFLSGRATRRVKLLNQTVDRIMRGDLHERLPLRGAGDDFDRLAASVNRMLDEIGRLLDEIKGVGDDIAHDLRTPLSRVRARLERGQAQARTREELAAAVDRAIVGLDQALAIVAALLRIREIEAGRRRVGFGPVDLAGVVREVEELYAPIAEEKRLVLETVAPALPPVEGDRDLLIEAVANLLGNAVKFTPEGGRVRLALRGEEERAVLGVSDTGPGIPRAERGAVLNRFYRGDKSRHVEGSGLGLSLVAAIARLHGFTLAISDASQDASRPGCLVELACPYLPGAAGQILQLTASA